MVNRVAGLDMSRRYKKPRSRITPKQRVVRRWRDAYCLWAQTLHKYVITLEGLIVRGEGATPREAWADAARRIAPPSTRTNP